MTEQTLHELLTAVAIGELTPTEAEAELAGYVTDDAGRFDAAREQRSGVPEAVLATGKTAAEVTALATTSLETTGRAIVTRVDATQREILLEQLSAEFPEATLFPDESTTPYERASTVVAHGSTFERPSLAARIGVVTAGTSDAVPAGEAEIIAQEVGTTVTRFDDIGVASLTRTLDQLPKLREQDVLVVAAGREGALPTVVAGLVDVPVIGLPVSTGYGHGGQGEAALSGMLQSCTALSVVNIDAGFTAGVQAGLIARQLDQARNSTLEPQTSE